MHLLDNPIRSDELLEKTVDITHRFYASSSEPMMHKELIELTCANGGDHLLKLYNDHSLGYAENSGSLDLRRELAALYGSEIEAENIVVFPGAQTGMTITAQALLHQGDHAIVITPSYQSLEEGIKYAGADVTRVGLSPNNDWQIDISAVKAAIRVNTKYIVLNDPHNPSGSLLAVGTKRELLVLAEKNDILIFPDEVYRLLELDPAARSASMAEMSANGLALGTMAKPFGCGGMGIGWVACQNKDVIEKLRKAQYMFTVCFSRAGEIQAMMALRVRNKIIKKNMAIIYQNLELLEAYFEENSDLFEWMPPQAGGTGFVKFKGPISSDEPAAQLLDEGILVFPSSIFDCDDDLKQYFRIGFSRRTVPTSLKAFSEFVKANRAAWGYPR